MKQKRQKSTLLLTAFLCGAMLFAGGCGTKQPTVSPEDTSKVSSPAEGTPAKPEDTESGSGHTCTVAIDCTDILEHKDQLKAEKADFLPEDGWILKETEADFEPGETAFDVIKEICGKEKINMDVRDTEGIYYIAGINQIYEFDCGDSSGWVYTVNGELPNYGYSEYVVQDQDEIELIYICDMNDYFAE